MKSSEFVAILKDIAKNYKTLYVMGCFGAPLNAKNKPRYCTNHTYNKQATRTTMIKAASEDTFGFDCVCLIKGILWGWSGNLNKTYGGAKYAVNGVPDIGANAFIKRCKNVSTTFDKLKVGECLWCEGHVGVYIGDGLAVECTPSWKNCVQITRVANMGKGTDYPNRYWTKHGLIPWIEYVKTIDDYKVGDEIEFIGNTHYVSSVATNGRICKPGKAKITVIAKGAKHPIHAVRLAGKGSTVYGWVNLEDIE